MAFFDKLNDLANNIGDKANEALEITKMNSKINSERAAMAEELRKLGEYYYGKYAEGEQLDEQTTEICQNITLHEKVIQETQAEINRVKNPVCGASNTSYSSQKSGKFCTSCGTSIAEGMKFCQGCGAKVE